MSAIEAGLAAASVVLNAGWPENSETQIKVMMTISKQISTSFSMMSSRNVVPDGRETMHILIHWCAPRVPRFTEQKFNCFKDIAVGRGG